MYYTEIAGKCFEILNNPDDRRRGLAIDFLLDMAKRMDHVMHEALKHSLDDVTAHAFLDRILNGPLACPKCEGELEFTGRSPS
jgi:hypothetical protein